jgi:hypothetical protein
MKERSSDKMNQNLDQTSHVRGHKKSPLWAKGTFFPLISSQGKKYKKLLQFFPLRQKRAVFFVYNNNIRLFWKKVVLIQ